MRSVAPPEDGFSRHAPARVRPARRPRRREAEHVNHDRWLVSYADFVTLLFAFFVTMYAISRVDADKLQTVVQSMQQAFQSDSPGAGTRPRAAARVPAAPVTPKEQAGFERLRARLAAQIAAQGMKDSVDLEVDDRGLVMSIREAGSFPVGSADLSPQAEELLRYVGTLVAEIDNQVRVEGHTDDVPIHTPRYASNWELSAARATNVVAFLIENTATRADHVSVAGYAEYRPRVGNDSDDHRARNRRVDLVILSPATRASEEPAAPPTAAQAPAVQSH